MVRAKKSSDYFDMRKLLDDIHEDIESNTIRFRWLVSEVTPAHRESDEYDDYWIPAKSKTVSPYFDTEEEAQAWMDQHEPDKGKHLAVHRQRLIKREYTKWVTY